MTLVAVSVDPPAEARKLADRLDLAFPLYSDPQGEVIRRWGVFDPKAKIAKPSTFLVEPGGAIAYRYVGKSATDRPSTEEILKRVGENQ